MKKVLLILLLNTSAWAACPLFTYPENHKLDAEINSICDNILNPTINYETVTKAVFNNLSVSTITAVSSETVTNLTVTTKATVPNGSASTDAAAFGQVKIVQTATGSSTTNATTTSISFVDSQLSAVITPLSASDKVLILACTSLEVDGSLKVGIATLANNTTNLMASSGQAVCSSGTGAAVVTCPVCMVFVDSPNATTQQTYKVRYRNTDGSTTIQNPGTSNTTQFMFLAEIQP